MTVTDANHHKAMRIHMRVAMTVTDANNQYNAMRIHNMRIAMTSPTQTTITMQ